MCRQFLFVRVFKCCGDGGKLGHRFFLLNRKNPRDPASLVACRQSRRLSNFAPAFDSALRLSQIKEKTSREAGFFFYCGDGRNRTAVQIIFLYESTKFRMFLRLTTV